VLKLIFVICLVPVAALPSVEIAGPSTPKRGRKRKHFDESSTQFSADLAKRRSTRVSQSDYSQYTLFTQNFIVFFISHDGDSLHLPSFDVQKLGVDNTEYVHTMQLCCSDLQGTEDLS